MNWMCITIAPKDGRQVLVHTAGEYHLVRWDAKQMCWQSQAGQALFPRKWAALPERPVEKVAEHS